MDFTDSDLTYSSDTDCEEEYMEFSHKNVHYNTFIHQQTILLSRIAKLERVVDNLAWHVEKLIDEMILAVKIIKQ
jgi:hypothetical protein